jgi:ferritin
VSYVYHSLFAYFDRDNVGLPGMAKFFKVSSDNNVVDAGCHCCYLTHAQR